MMATTEERMKILKMISEDKISAEEGAQLLTALSQSEKAPTPRPKAGTPRWLRVKVTDVGSGRSKATVQIPLALVDAGMKIGAHFAPELEGMEMDSITEAFQQGITGKIVDVIDEDDGEHVEIYIE
ncbi:MAG: hypothetical protein HN392_10955 [Anaerolineae bacterium]|jgi:hypothetical protein|nr:hypothetical protein [Anaerolineae bacterium]MBT7073653.1 hypothetical protein [Anaerolineae bacterium]MBT7782954.1 hypothetical protein [Anaerolineae bacterium]